jgi:hypothetical protein
MSVSVDEHGTAVRPRPVPLLEVKCERRGDLQWSKMVL